MRDVNKFISGFKHFQNDWLGTDAGLFEKLRTGQSPATMVIAEQGTCLFSPALIIQQELTNDLGTLMIQIVSQATE
jgi:hypothetical protein